MTETIARDALVHWGLKGSRVRLVAKRENHVYQVVDGSGTAYALRLHRPGYQSRASLMSELELMQYLSACELSVPKPIATKLGDPFVEHDGYSIDLLSWLDGKQIGSNQDGLDVPDRNWVLKEIGIQMAQVHECVDAWTFSEGFTRPRWDIDGLVGEAPLWGRFWDNPKLTPKERQTLTEFRASAADALTTHSDNLEFGLIHADLIRENVLLSGDKIHLIDFDDCGFGFRLFDVATTLMKNEDEPDRDGLNQAFIGGYRSVRPLDTAMLPLFLMLRACSYVGWIMDRMDVPGSEVKCSRSIQRAIDIIENSVPASV